MADTVTGATSNAPAIEALPPHLRTQVVDRLISGASSRDVSAYLLQQGHKVSHSAVARYSRRVLKPALKVGAKLQKLEGEAQSGREQAIETASLTKEVLAASPLISRVSELWGEVKEDLRNSRGSENLSGRAASINAGRGLIETEAKLLGVGGYGAQAQQGGTLVQIAVLAPQESGNPAVNVQIAEIQRRSE